MAALAELLAWRLRTKVELSRMMDVINTLNKLTMRMMENIQFSSDLFALIGLKINTTTVLALWVCSVHSLTHWGRVTHICVGKLTMIGSDNGLSLDGAKPFSEPML